MNRRSLARVVALVAALLAVGIASGCSSTLRNAATVTFAGSDNTVDIRRDQFEDQVRQVSKAQAKLDAQQNDGTSSPTTSRSTATVNTALASNWLQSRIYGAAFQEMFDSRDLKMTDALRERGRQSAFQSYGGEETFKQFPKDLQEELIHQQALIEGIRADEQQNAPTNAQPSEADARAYFEEHKDTLTACASGKQVSHILVADEALANDIIAQLNGGASFADLAASQSTDTGSAANGGKLGCLQPNAYVPEFQQAADAAPFNQVVGPVQTQYGYHVILVTPFSTSYEDLREQIMQQLQAEAAQQSSNDVDQRLLKELNDTLGKAKVTVDPRYGTWRFDKAASQWSIKPPVAPDPRTQREPVPSTTTTLPLSIGG